jgi:hypothetical protein
VRVAMFSPRFLNPSLKPVNAPLNDFHV